MHFQVHFQISLLIVIMMLDFLSVISFLKFKTLSQTCESDGIWQEYQLTEHQLLTVSGQFLTVDKNLQGGKHYQVKKNKEKNGVNLCV